MRCSACGAEVDSGLLFCPSCGALAKSSEAKIVGSDSKPNLSQVDETFNQQLGYTAERRKDSEARAQTGQPTAFQQVHESVYQPQQSGASETDNLSTVVNSEFEIVQRPDGNDSDRGQSGPSSKILIGLVIALVAVVVILGVMLLGTRGTSSSDTQSLNSSNQTQGEYREKAVDEESSELSNSSESNIGSEPPLFPNATASSQLPGDDKDPDYGPNMARDGNLITAWNEGAPGDGVGEWIQLEASEKQHVAGLRIAAGFQKNEKIYGQNRRPRAITISFEDGTSLNAQLDDAFGRYQTIAFDKPKDTRIVRITINSTYQGQYFDDCCISEIEEY